ncbi:MAG TPA: hypothetical protein VI462_11685 [Acidimicrobiia bacterium]
MVTSSKPSESPVDAGRVLRLLDTTNPQAPVRISCMSAALREARKLTGRDEVSGELVTPRHEGTWAGALVYLVFAEQIGECFHPLNVKPHRRPTAADALTWFGKVAGDDAMDLDKVRNRLAHDYTLVAAPGAPRTTRFMFADARY